MCINSIYEYNYPSNVGRVVLWSADRQPYCKMHEDFPFSCLCKRRRMQQPRGSGRIAPVLFVVSIRASVNRSTYLMDGKILTV